MKKEIFYDLAAEIEKECGDWEQGEGFSEEARAALLAKVAQMDGEVPEKEAEKVRHLPVKKRYLLVLAAALTLLLGLGAMGDRAWISRKENMERASELTTKIDNEEKISVLREEEDIYQEIGEVLGIAPLRLGYLPDGMELDSYSIIEDTGWAYVNYVYEGELITVQMSKIQKEQSGNVQWDGIHEKIEGVQNIYGHEIEAYCVDEKEQKYDAKILYGNGYYEIFGCFSEKNEFFCILEQLFFKNV